MRQYGDAKLTELLQTLGDCAKAQKAGVRDCKAVRAGLDFVKDQPCTVGKPRSRNSP
jgi:hypothetical protein